MKENDYIRTEKGITKITYIGNNGKKNFCDTHLFGRTYIESIDVTKSSHNIIDLIEVGDYLNGCRVLSIEKIHEKPNGWVDIEDWGVGSVFHDEIKEILTKEQYEREVFRV